MRTFDHLYERLVSFENLHLAFVKTVRGKKSNPKVGEFARRWEEELFSLQQELEQKAYRPGPYRTFFIYEKKRRMISAAPVRDRVVHHALCNIIEPLFEPTFIFDSYANRKGKGTHRAVERCAEFAQRNRCVLKCDIRKYFPSMDHEVLKEALRRKIRDPDVLWLCDLIIDHSNAQEEVIDYFPGDELFTPIQRVRGLPIGNQTSQFFANVYLNAFDHFVKETLRCRCYIRYVDDFLIFGGCKEGLAQVVQEVIGYLQRVRVKVPPNKAHVYPVECGIPFLGYIVFPTHIRLAADNVRRFRRRLRKLQASYGRGSADVERVRHSICGWLGHAKHASTYNLRKAVFRSLVFVRSSSVVTEQRSRQQATGTLR